jgi:integrase
MSRPRRVTPPVLAPMSDADARVIAEWATAMRHGGWTRAGVERGAKTLRRLARFCPEGVLRAGRTEILTFAAAKANGLPASALMRSASWHRAVRLLDGFYAWAARRFGLPDGSPMAKLRRLPRAGGPSATEATVGAWRRYDRVLNVDGVSPRTRAILFVLAHGLTPAELSQLQLEDVDLVGQALHVGGPRARRIPLSARVIDVLKAWLAVRPSAPWCFPSATAPEQRISRRAVYEAVAHAAVRAFPRPQQAELRRRIRPGGFRELFVARLLRRGVAADVLGAVLGERRITLPRRGLVPVTAERLIRELTRARRRWRRWI